MECGGGGGTCPHTALQEGRSQCRDVEEKGSCWAGSSSTGHGSACVAAELGAEGALTQLKGKAWSTGAALVSG